jgi:hypothetical protein
LGFAALAIVIAIKVVLLECAAQFLDRGVVKIDAQVEFGVIIVAIDHHRRRPFGQMPIITDLATSIAAGLDRSQKSPIE